MPGDTPFQAGEPVLLIDERRGKRHLVVLRPGVAFHSDRGYIGHDALIGASDGTTVKSSMGTAFLALRPTLGEYVLEMPRGAQVIYPKDLATICFFADIGPGQVVCEAGLGSGALTLALLRAVGPSGRVISYETREEFARRACRNIEARLGDGLPLTVRMQDVYAGIEERALDRVLLDLPEPWRLVEAAATALRAGGIFCAYVPTLPQAQQTHEALAAHPAFALAETFETLLRPWHIAGLSVRPAHRMVAHTGFITLARRVLPRAGGARVAPPAPDEPEEPEPA
ncbi:MAG TPA: tRNA (adenine-N1)-methyltransferase [Methylomirabilota bacterium]|jgi:tRNA (adenine57-N1/adenine58-N1)-methyltransferase|nr:tRNA (adenine-N1)-methyltransferase [Methylomirabilota bacterium]